MGKQGPQGDSARGSGNGAQPERTAPRKKFQRWSEEEIEVVREQYNGTIKSSERIAAKLGTTPKAVTYQAYKMGLGQRKAYRPWTVQEDDLLRALVPRKSPGQIATRMKRSVHAITVRAKRIRVSFSDREGWYTQAEACEILGVNREWIARRIESGVIKASWHHGRRPGRSGSGSWHIEQKDLGEFLRRYPHDLNGRNVDLVQVVEIIAGLLPVRRDGEENN